MKNIKIYNSEKYQSNGYEKVADGIYKNVIAIDNKFKPISADEIENDNNWVKENGIDTLVNNDVKYIRMNNQIFRQDITKDNTYVMSLSFEQEPEYGENSNCEKISQYPLEDILEKYNVYVSDEYEKLNKSDNDICYLELGSSALEDIQNLQSIIGKHVYNKEENGLVKLVIE